MTDRQYQVKTEPVVAGPETVTADRWFQPFSQPLISAVRRAAVVLAVTAGGVVAVDPVSTPTTNTGWISSLSEPARPIRGLNAALQSPFTIDPKVLTLKEATTVDRWFTSLSEPARFAKSAALQSSFTVDPKVLTLPETTTVSRWFLSLNEPVRLPRGLSPALQQSFTVDAKALTLKEATSVDRWFVQWKDPLKRPPPSSLQEDSYADQKPVVIAATSEDRWHQPFSEPPRSLRGLSAALQQSATIDPVALTRPETTTVDRWFSALSEPLRFAKSAALFRVDTQSTLPIPNPPFSDVRWFNNLSEPVRQPRGLTAAQQTAFFVDPKSLTLPEQTTADRWFVPFSNPVLRSGDVSRQLAAGAVFQLTAQVTLDGWYIAWSEPVRSKSLPAAHQQAIGFVATVSVPLDAWYRKLEEPVRLRPGLSAALQQAVATDPVSLTRPENITLDKWYAPLGEPVRPPRGLPAYLQVAYSKDTFTPKGGVLISDPAYTVSMKELTYTVSLGHLRYTVKANPK